ncbi:type II toxin-antitoxin system RelE/ParE family toxin [Shewanella algae]|uniref:type II toxin-antitoxin system RelE/ParE family toxin n=1 Tax=Shewanella algae TaxID=38313 RepID=UPI001AAFA03B|nr:type II toxin-antitoxin system RelE/ParE family toxin [Shewanella algae]MBO2588851.1 type II toxin-antitoxin system RelE/ParE family toxin [Shewanella algae]
MYKLSNLAADDFAGIYLYTLQAFGPHQADCYTEDLENTFGLLSRSPNIGRTCQDIAEGLLRHDHQRHAIFYRKTPQGIFVIRILHQQMEPMKHFSDF